MCNEVLLNAAEMFRYSPGEYNDAKTACVKEIMNTGFKLMVELCN